MNGEMTLRLRADPAAFGRVRRTVGQIVGLLGGSDEATLELEVATGEALANVYRHAYRAAPGPVEVEVAFDDRTIEVRIEDHGDADIAVPDIPKTPPAEGEHRGLYLIGRLTDKAEVVRRRGQRGTTIHLVKCVGRAALRARISGLDAHFSRHSPR